MDALRFKNGNEQQQYNLAVQFQSGGIFEMIKRRCPTEMFRSNVALQFLFLFSLSLFAILRENRTCEQSNN